MPTHTTPPLADAVIDTLRESLEYHRAGYADAGDRLLILAAEHKQATIERTRHADAIAQFEAALGAFEVTQ